MTFEIFYRICLIDILRCLFFFVVCSLLAVLYFPGSCFFHSLWFCHWLPFIFLCFLLIICLNSLLIFVQDSFFQYLFSCTIYSASTRTTTKHVKKQVLYLKNHCIWICHPFFKTCFCMLFSSSFAPSLPSLSFLPFYSPLRVSKFSYQFKLSTLMVLLVTFTDCGANQSTCWDPSFS